MFKDAVGSKSCSLSFIVKNTSLSVQSLISNNDVTFFNKLKLGLPSSNLELNTNIKSSQKRNRAYFQYSFETFS